MSTYKIIPQASMLAREINNPMAKNPVIGDDSCRKLCDDSEECVAFQYAPKMLGVCGDTLVHRPVGVCKLYSNIGPMKLDNDITVYVKGPRKTYLMLWIFLAILGLVVFVSLAQKK